MAVTLEQFSSLISQIYGSAMDPTLWQGTLVNITSTLGEAGEGMLVSLIKEGGGVGRLMHYLPVNDGAGNQEVPQELLQLLIPHFQQAMHTQVRIGQLEADRESFFNLLQYAQHGTILATQKSQVLFTNTVALDILERYEGIGLNSGELQCRSASEQAILKRLVSSAGGMDAHSTRSAGSFCVRGTNNQPNLAVHVLPIGDGRTDGYGKTVSVLIVIVDPDHDPEPQLEILRRLYGLTKAEAAVAVLIPRGDGLQAVAETLGVSISTVRIHLQRVFEKTGTHRQTELVRLLLTVQAGIRFPEF